MKLQKGIVLGGGRKLALAVGLVALATGAAHATTYYSGAGAANGYTLAEVVKWYTDSGRKTLADPQPTPTANDDNTYVFLESKKMMGDCSFPEGTHVCFGTTTTAWGPNCQSVTWTIPDCTIYGVRYCPNYGDSGQFLGNYRLVKTVNDICFGSSNLPDGRTYGMYFAGTFTGESDVMISIGVINYTGSTGTGITRTVFNGDFSGYKGRFQTYAAAKGVNLVWFASASAMGDPATPFTDAITLRNNARLRIDEVVTQTSARGITVDLSSGQTAYLYAPANVSWTLRAPVYGGATGTLAKEGAGTVTLADSLEAKNIRVAAGTLIVDTTASFAAGTTITVASGAKLVYKGLGAIPNVTIVVEEGGVYTNSSLDAIPFDGTVVETVDCTTVTAAERAVMPKPISVALSQSIPVPFSETNRWAIATFDAAAGFVAADFADATAKSFHRLPTTWLETATENGVTTLYLVARPAVEYLYNSSNPAGRLATASNWSDGELPHKGKDYFSRQGTSSNRTGTGSNIASYSFNGESLTVNGGIGAYAQDIFVSELRLRADNQLMVAHGSGNSYLARRFRGLYDIDDSCTDSKPAKVTIDARTTYADFQAELVGSGTFQFNTGVKSVADGGNGIYPFYLTGMSTNFLGRLEITESGATSFMDMYVTNGAAFGGPLPAYSANAVRINPNSGSVDAPHAVSITAMADTTVDAANRGWQIASGTLGASNGVTFVFAPPTLTLMTKLCKTGGGTLALGCDTIGAGTAFAVEEGYVKALSAGCCTNLNLTVSAGAGIKADLAPADATVAANGLIAKSILPAEEGGTILAAVDMPEGDEPMFSAVICTVPSTQDDLSTTLKPVQIHGYTGRIEKDAETYASEGLVTYTAMWLKEGFTIIVR